MKRFLALWAVFYLAIYCLPFPFGFISGTAQIIESYYVTLIKTADWFGVHVLGLEEKVGPIVGGDTRASYLLVCLFVFSGFVAALSWVALKHEEKDPPVHRFIYHYVRFALANYLLYYGWNKILLPGQFGELTPGRLMQSYGDSSPMDLLWTFMAASSSYTIFTGVLEVAAGTLLFIRRFVSLGALLSLGIMANVFMLNVSYGVQVKLFSFHLLLFSFFLIAPDFKRLCRFFILNLPTEPKVFPPAVKKHRGLFLISELTLIFALSISAIYSGLKAARYYNESIAAVKFFGVWKVVEFSEGSKSDRWARVAFDVDDKFYVRTSDGGWLEFQAEYDYDKNKFSLKGISGTPSVAHFDFSESKGEELLMSGQIDSKDVSIQLKKEVHKSRLQEEGFRWVR